MDYLAFKNLTRGDIVRSKATGKSYLVESRLNDHVILVLVETASNPTEWDLIKKVKHVDTTKKVTPLFMEHPMHIVDGY